MIQEGISEGLGSYGWALFRKNICIQRINYTYVCGYRTGWAIFILFITVIWMLPHPNLLEQPIQVVFEKGKKSSLLSCFLSVENIMYYVLAICVYRQKHDNNLCCMLPMSDLSRRLQRQWCHKLWEQTILQVAWEINLQELYQEICYCQDNVWKFLRNNNNILLMKWFFFIISPT